MHTCVHTHIHTHTYTITSKYNLRSFLQYRKWIKKIYPEDYVRDFWISILPEKLAFQLFTGNLIGRIDEMKRDGGYVYIFGAGRHAAECAAFFDECHIKYDGFVVTSLEGNPEELRNHVVYKAADQLKNRKSLIVIAVLSSGISNVENTLDILKDNNTIIDTILFTE